MSSSLAVRTRFIVGTAFALSIGAMVRYPGGTALDSTTRGYSLSQNFLSDLGMTVGYNHVDNRLGAGLFVLSLLLLVIGLGHAASRIARHLASHAASRRWAGAAIFASVCACVAFTGVALTPENNVMALHVAFTVWAFRIMPVAALLFAIASFRSPGLRERTGITWLFMTLVLTGYTAFLAWGPTVSNTNGLVAQVIAQKFVTIITLGTVLFVSQEVDRGVMHAAR